MLPIIHKSQKNTISHLDSPDNFSQHYRKASVGHESDTKASVGGNGSSPASDKEDGRNGSTRRRALMRREGGRSHAWGRRVHGGDGQQRRQCVRATQCCALPRVPLSHLAFPPAIDRTRSFASCFSIVCPLPILRLLLPQWARFAASERRSRWGRPRSKHAFPRADVASFRARRVTLSCAATSAQRIGQREAVPCRLTALPPPASWFPCGGEASESGVCGRRIHHGPNGASSAYREARTPSKGRPFQ